MFTLVRFFKFAKSKLMRRSHRSQYQMPQPGEVPYFRAGDVWWCTLETVVRSASNGTPPKAECRRPVLIYKRFTHNSFLGLQITKQGRGGAWYEPIEFEDKQRWVMLHRPITMEAERLLDCVGCVDDATLNRVRERFVGLYQF